MAGLFEAVRRELVDGEAGVLAEEQTRRLARLAEFPTSALAAEKSAYVDKGEHRDLLVREFEAPLPPVTGVVPPACVVGKLREFCTGTLPLEEWQTFAARWTAIAQKNAPGSYELFDAAVRRELMDGEEGAISRALHEHASQQRAAAAANSRICRCGNSSASGCVFNMCCYCCRNAGGRGICIRHSNRW